MHVRILAWSRLKDCWFTQGFTRQYKHCMSLIAIYSWYYKPCIYTYSSPTMRHLISCCILNPDAMTRLMRVPGLTWNDAIKAYIWTTINRALPGAYTRRYTTPSTYTGVVVLSERRGNREKEYGKCINFTKHSNRTYTFLSMRIKLLPS